MARRRVPFVQQMETADCGAACLAMVLGYFGRTVPLDNIRQRTGSGRDGVSAFALLQAARSYGLDGRAVALEPSGATGLLPPGSIIHWEGNHFVVYEGQGRGGVRLIDPARGRRQVASDQFGRSFSGVALLLQPGETFAERAPGTRLRSIWRHLRAGPWHRPTLARILAASLVLQLLALAVPALTGILVDRLIPGGEMRLLWLLGAGILAMAFAGFAAALMRGRVLLALRNDLDRWLTGRFVEHLATLPFRFFQERTAGDLAARANSSAIIRELLTTGALTAVLDGALVVIYLGLLLAMNPALGLLALALGLLQVAVFALTRRSSQELMARSLQAQARAQGHLVQMLAGMETLKALGAEHRAAARWAGLFGAELDANRERAMLTNLVEAVAGALRLGSPLVLLVAGGAQVINGRMGLGAMLALNAIAVSFLAPLSALVSNLWQVQQAGSYLERINDVLDMQPEQEPAAVPRPVAPLTGAFAAEGVGFRYSGQSPPAVYQASFAIQPGQFVGIVGRSGSGKSTLAKLLLGLYRPTEGRIRYDGSDLAELDLRALRSKIGVVTQHPYLFGDTIRANIALAGPGATDAEIEAAARLAQIHEEIAALPMGYDTILADNGASLSGGQRQRLALARALVRRPAILLLDEATSALDTLTERSVQTALAELSCTRIVIAQRLSTIREADMILVMESGRIVERGTHEELLALGGCYAELVTAQAGGAD